MCFIEHYTESKKPNGCMGTDVVSVAVFHPFDQVTDWELQLPSPLSTMGTVISHITSPGKDPDSKFKVQFLLNVCHFYTIVESKNC